MIAPIQSIAQLRSLAGKNPKYHQLALAAAENQGLEGDDLDLNAAISWLNEIAKEDGEENVVEEINFCRDLIQ
jgi:hypothetical protein